MKLSEFLGGAGALTRENFVKLQRNRRVNPEAFDEFCKRMNEAGGYGALR